MNVCTRFLPFKARRQPPWRHVLLLLAVLAVSLSPVAGQRADAAEPATPDVILLEQSDTPAGVRSTVQIGVHKDAFISSHRPNDNFGGDSALRLGWRSGHFDAMRILIEFDIGAIPRNAHIHKAELNIFQFVVEPGSDHSAMTYRAQYMRSSWDERGVTWNNANYLGADSLPLGSVDPGIGWKSADVTDLVKSWYSGARPNHGLIITGDEVPSANRERGFHSREEGNSAPHIIVEYTVQCDTTPPVASVEPLPAFSAGKFRVHWSGVDHAPHNCAPTGIDTYDIEYRINGGGWHRWKNQTHETSHDFRNFAADGDFVEFRGRATDHAGNSQSLGNPQASTRIDGQPPVVTVNPLPPVTTASHFVLSWSAVDPVSGVAHYDVQWRENGGPWQMLLEETTQTSHQLTGVAHDVTYDFRVRATDHAGNTDPWSNGPQATTTVRSAHPTSHMLPFQPSIIKPGAPVTTTIALHWQAFAEPDAPIANIEIHYQYNGGAWQLWQSFPAGTTSAQFPYQQLGHGDGLYGFESVAVGTNGQREPLDSRAEANIVVDLADTVQPRAHLPLVVQPRNVAAAQQ
jgi:chitodextrinase